MIKTVNSKSYEHTQNENEISYTLYINIKKINK